MHNQINQINQINQLHHLHINYFICILIRSINLIGVNDLQSIRSSISVLCLLAENLGPHRDSIPGPSSPQPVAIPTELPGRRCHSMSVSKLLTLYRIGLQVLVSEKAQFEVVLRLFLNTHCSSLCLLMSEVISRYFYISCLNLVPPHWSQLN